MSEDAKRARQRRIVIILGVVLIAGGVIMLFTLKRMPLPMRILAGLTDTFAGLVLIVAGRQMK